MKHYEQPIMVYKPRGSEPVKVVVLAHSKDGYSTVLFADGHQARVSRRSLKHIKNTTEA